MSAPNETYTWDPTLDAANFLSGSYLTFMPPKNVLIGTYLFTYSVSEGV